MIEIYPDGFLPIIAPEVTDYSAAVGVRWKLGDWDMDSSLVYGKNEMEFTIENTLNRSLGTASKTVFDAGGFDYDQLVLNVSGVRSVEIGAFASPLNVAVGIEARRETYSIFAGEPDSYRNGGVLLNGAADGVGRAGVPGLPAGERRRRRPHRRRRVRRPGGERHREVPRVGRAARRELLGLRREPLRQARGALRLHRQLRAARLGAERLPRAVAASSSSSPTTSTNFIDGVPFDITTFPVTDPVAQRARRAGARCGGVDQLLARRGAAARRCRHHGRRLSHRHRRPHRAVGEPDVGGSAQLPHARRASSASAAAASSSTASTPKPKASTWCVNWPLSTSGAGRFDFTLTGELQLDRRDARADDGAARGAESAAACCSIASTS